jgi:hypothetical protein
MEIVLVILACLNGECHEHPVPLNPEVTLLECMKHGQQGVAEWKQHHQAHQVEKFRCYTAEEFRRRGVHI